MGEHTPGPWVQFIDRGNGFIAIMPAGRSGEITRVEMLSPAWDADSRLIAAAPDMLKALRTCLCPAGGWTGMPKDMIVTVQDCVDAGMCGCDCGAAIARATGNGTRTEQTALESHLGQPLPVEKTGA
jgi:hypothetical protein